MPLVKVELRAGKPAGYKKAILDGVHAALVASIGIPDYDRFQRLYELEPENFEIPPNKSGNAVLIEIVMFKGRSIEAKKRLFREIVANLSREPGISGDDITIVLQEPPLENWGIKGGKPANEVELGFKVDV
jgi:phenylpyruvate tautomerase PptA (4-oxalocrotonate tautomerase family)